VRDSHCCGGDSSPAAQPSREGQDPAANGSSINSPQRYQLLSRVRTDLRRRCNQLRALRQHHRVAPSDPRAGARKTTTQLAPDHELEMWSVSRNRGSSNRRFEVCCRCFIPSNTQHVFPRAIQPTGDTSRTLRDRASSARHVRGSTWLPASTCCGNGHASSADGHASSAAGHVRCRSAASRPRAADADLCCGASRAQPPRNHHVCSRLLLSGESVAETL
jgi:hypothetical protein